VYPPIKNQHFEKPSYIKPTMPKQKSGSIIWSAICRNEVILAEAGEDSHGGAVIELAQKLLEKKPTAGWECEFHQFKIMILICIDVSISIFLKVHLLLTRCPFSFVVGW
jgi:hypothetical protein